jgi:hypothetical protein
MSLRIFHLVFIAVSIVLAAFVAAWAVGEYQTGRQMSYVLTAIGSIAAAGALAVYGAMFQRKTRQL